MGDAIVGALAAIIGGFVAHWVSTRQAAAQWERTQQAQQAQWDREDGRMWIEHRHMAYRRMIAAANALEAEIIRVGTGLQDNVQVAAAFRELTGALTDVDLHAADQALVGLAGDLHESARELTLAAFNDGDGGYRAQQEAFKAARARFSRAAAMDLGTRP